MIGQGSPNSGRVLSASATRKVAVGGFTVLATLLLWASAAFAEVAATQVRLRFEWGGGARRTWRGAIEIEPGQLAELEPLGIEADEPGALWIEKNQIRIEHLSGRTYDAFDVLVSADVGATLTVSLGEGASPAQDKRLTIPLASVLNETFNAELDAEGNRLLVRRAPGDRMRVKTERASLVYAPHESFTFNLQPQLPNVAPGTQLRCVTRLLPARGATVLWSVDQNVTMPAVGESPLDLKFDVPTPAQDGAYDVQVLVFERSLRQRLVNAVLPQPLAERKIQIVVVAPQPTPAPRAAANQWHTVGEINPANPGWWKRLVMLPQLTLIPGWPQGPLRSGDAAPVAYPLGDVIRFAEQRTADDTTWEAYPLPIDRLGAPHILEIDYPSNVPQHLGVSLIEPNASGAVLPIGLDSGFYLGSEAQADQPGIVRHRLIFWPKTKTPLVLLTQRSRQTPALFSKLRVLAGPARLPTSAPLVRLARERLVAGYFDRPLFPENFGATGVVDDWSGQTIDDWETFYQGGARLVDYLNHAGYNGLMLTVWGDGSAIYPSEILQSTPRYDTGLLGTGGLDPQRKDALEMLLRLFDREQLQLVPTLQFAAPLPALEALRRRGGPEAVGLQWVGASGATWMQRNMPDRSLAPYYNLLDPRVQTAMLDVISELATRSARHRAFTGVAIQLSAEGYAQLPGPEWGFDDQTMARFEKETGVKLPPGTGPERFNARAAVLLGPQRARWLEWRARTVADFYIRAEQTIAAARPNAKLYLTGVGLFDGPTAQRQLRPALPQTGRLEQVLLDVGIAPEMYRARPNLVLLRPNRIAPPDPLPARAIDLQINTVSELDNVLAQTAAPGGFFYHPRQRMRLRSFEQQSPFGADNTYALLVEHPSPSGDWNRRRFIRALAAIDAAAMFDGGWMLPLGQEESLRGLFAVYRQLPAKKFQTSPASKLPLTIRTLTEDQHTLLYVVNDSPWPTTVTLQLSTSPGCTWTTLSVDGPGAPQSLATGTQTLALRPFELAAARLSQPNIAVRSADLQLDPGVDLALNARIEELGARAAALADQPPWEVLPNAGFESLGPAATIPGWSLVNEQGIELALDPIKPQSGSHALRLKSTRQVASLQSDLFDAPGTGRLAVKVWLRAESTQNQPVLRLALEGAHDGKTYYRYAPVGGSQPGSVPMQTEWTPYLFQVDDLPAEGLEQLRVRFDLMGPGTVWLDEVQLFHLKFNKNERVELSKILDSARRALHSGEVADCQRLLQSYWPQFLTHHVPLDPAPLARQTRLPDRPAPNKPAPATEDPSAFGRLKNLVPKWPF